MAQNNIDLLKLARQWQNEGNRVALATVLETWGSAPRPQGSFLIIRDDGVFAGSVSGGCVEGDVIVTAQDVLNKGEARVLNYGVSNAMAWEVGLACGGKISILVEPYTGQLEIPEPPFVLAQSTIHGWSQNFHPQSHPAILGSIDITEDALTALRSDRPQFIGPQPIDGDMEGWLLNPINPALKLTIIGAVHIAQSLAPLAVLMGYEVRLIDPRPGFANAARFKDFKVVEAWPDEALSTQVPDSRTAIITLSHDPKVDDPALELALGSSAFYIGALGSKKTHAARLQRLKAKGFDDAALTRIQGPAGLAIGSRTPAEIAISIMAQMTQALRMPL